MIQANPILKTFSQITALLCGQGQAGVRAIQPIRFQGWSQMTQPQQCHWFSIVSLSWQQRRKACWLTWLPGSACSNGFPRESSNKSRAFFCVRVFLSSIFPALYWLLPDLPWPAILSQRLPYLHCFLLIQRTVRIYDCMHGYIFYAATWSSNKFSILPGLRNAYTPSLTLKPSPENLHTTRKRSMNAAYIKEWNSTPKMIQMYERLVKLTSLSFYKSETASCSYPIVNALLYPLLHVVAVVFKLGDSVPHLHERIYINILPIQLPHQLFIHSLFSTSTSIVHGSTQSCCSLFFFRGLKLSFHYITHTDIILSITSQPWIT